MSDWQGFRVFDTSQPRTIRFRLLALVTLILVPLLVLTTGLAIKLARAERTAIEVKRANVARRISERADGQVSRHIVLLNMLANSAPVGSEGLAELEKSLAKLQNQSIVVRAWAFTQDGPIPAARSTEIPEPEPGFYGRALQSNSAVSGIKGVGKAAVFSIGVPIKSGERAMYGVAAEINAAKLNNELFNESGMGEDWVGAIVDRENRFIARSLDSDRRVGQLARPELGVAAAGPVQSGVFENVTWEGAEVLNVFYRSALTNWTTVVAVPKADLTAPLDRKIGLALLGGCTLLLVAMAWVSRQARRIAEPVRNISKFAVAMSEGRPYIESNHRIVELDDVRVALEKTMTKTAHLAALVASNADAILSTDIDGKILTWNSGAENLFGYTSDEIVGQSKMILVPKNRIRELELTLEEVLEGKSVRLETVRRLRDGSLADVSISSAPIRKPDGEIIAVSFIIRDIRDRKSADAHVQLLMRELAHRSKNQIAVIQAIANRTSLDAETVEDFASSFGQRLRALAASYDLLIDQNWKGVRLGDLVRKQLQIFVQEDRANLDTQGPVVDLPATAAEALGLALHELATNSVKYGAWSKPMGKVTVAWDIATDADGATMLQLTWAETGGPLVKSPVRKGFGSIVIEKMVASSLNGSAKIDFAPGGIKWHLLCPVPSQTSE